MSLVSDEEFIGAFFKETTSIERIHSYPRFGYTSDIEYAASGNEEIQWQYFFGLIFVPAVITIFFVVWTMMLVVFKFLGSSRIGIYSGEVPLLPLLPNENTQTNRENNRKKDSDQNVLSEIEEWQYEYERTDAQLGRIRLIFLCCGGIVLVCSVAIYTAGLAPLERSFIAARDEVAEFQGIIHSTAEQMENQHAESSAMIPKRDAVVDNITSWCSSVEYNFTVDRNDIVNESVFSLELESYVFRVDYIKNSLVNSYTDLGAMISDGALTVQRSLQMAQSTAEEIEDVMTTFIFWYGLSLFFIIAIDAMTFIFIGGSFMASKDVPCYFFETIQVCILFPLFTILINLSWVIAVIFIVVAVLSADICTGSPEKNLIAIFNQKQQTLDPLLYSMTVYYVDECMQFPVDTELKPTRFFEDFTSYIDTAISTTNNALVQINSIDPISLENNCGDDVALLTRQLDDFSAELKTLRYSTTTSSASLYCSTFTPMYTDIIHDQVCYRGVSSIETTFILILTIAISAMVMITLRVAVKTIEIGEYEEDYDYVDEEELELQESSYAVTGGERLDRTGSRERGNVSDNRGDRNYSPFSKVSDTQEDDTNKSGDEETKIASGANKPRNKGAKIY